MFSRWFVHTVRLINVAAGKAGVECHCEIQPQAPVFGNLLHYKLGTVSLRNYISLQGGYPPHFLENLPEFLLYAAFSCTGSEIMSVEPPRGFCNLHRNHYCAHIIVTLKFFGNDAGCFWTKLQVYFRRLAAAPTEGMLEKHSFKTA